MRILMMTMRISSNNYLNHSLVMIKITNITNITNLNNNIKNNKKKCFNNKSLICTKVLLIKLRILQMFKLVNWSQKK